MRGHEKFTTSLEISSSPPPGINNDCSLDSCVLISGFILAHVCWSDAVVSSIVFITESQLRICSLPTVYCLSTWKIKDSWWCGKWFISARRMQRTHFMAVYLYAINSAMSPLSWNLEGICEKTILDFLHCRFYKVAHNRSYLHTFFGQFSLFTFHVYENTGPETVQNRPSR
jgi:hypothetical protein